MIRKRRRSRFPARICHNLVEKFVAGAAASDGVGRMFIGEKPLLRAPKLPEVNHRTHGFEAMYRNYIIRRTYTNRDNNFHWLFPIPCGSHESPLWHSTIPWGGRLLSHRDRTLRRENQCVLCSLESSLTIQRATFFQHLNLGQYK
jgi:hypothetical protein